jgi:hypothetical protein
MKLSLARYILRLLRKSGGAKKLASIAKKLGKPKSKLIKQAASKVRKPSTSKVASKGWKSKGGSFNDIMHEMIRKNRFDKATLDKAIKKSRR